MIPKITVSIDSSEPVCGKRVIVESEEVFLEIFLEAVFGETTVLSVTALSVVVSFEVGVFEDTTVGSVILVVDAVNAVEVVDRKSTRLNSSHVSISYAVFCLKKKSGRRRRGRAQRRFR